MYWVYTIQTDIGMWLFALLVLIPTFIFSVYHLKQGLKLSSYKYTLKSLGAMCAYYFTYERGLDPKEFSENSPALLYITKDSNVCLKVNQRIFCTPMTSIRWVKALYPNSYLILPNMEMPYINIDRFIIAIESTDFYMNDTYIILNCGASSTEPYRSFNKFIRSNDLPIVDEILQKNLPVYFDTFVHHYDENTN